MSTSYDLADVGRIGLGLLNTLINPERFLEGKLQRASQALKKYDLDAAICLTEPNITYVSNVPPLGALSAGVGGYRYALFIREGKHVIYFDECDIAYHIANQFPYLKVEKSIPVAGGVMSACPPSAQEYMLSLFCEQIDKLLKDYKVPRERIGIDANIPLLINALERHLKIKASLDGARALTEARTIKTPEEQRIFQVLAAVVDGAFEVAYKTIKPGVREYEVWAEICRYLIRHGVEPGGYIISGQHTWPKDISRSCTDRIIRLHDTVVIDIFNARLLGYTSCCYRTFCVGRPSKELKEAYERALNWLREAEKRLRPGSTTKDVVEVWPDEVDLWSNRPPFIRSEAERFSTFFNNMGHGLGVVTLYDPPFFWKPVSIKWPVELQSGMVISLETQEGTPDNRLGVRIEDMIIITDTGYNVISRWPADTITEVPP
ncbi:MAG: Xaa-Pro peptidase family protein [Thermoproteota archaeon]